MRLFEHKPHPHKPRNVNEVHAEELSGLNTKIALTLTRYVGSMWCAYVFSGIGVGAVVGAITGNILLALIFGSISSNFLQLVLLPVIMVAQNVLNRKAELQADEQFNTTKMTLEYIRQMMEHLGKQDEELIKQSSILLEILNKQP